METFSSWRPDPCTSRSACVSLGHAFDGIIFPVGSGDPSRQNYRNTAQSLCFADLNKLYPHRGQHTLEDRLFCGVPAFPGPPGPRSLLRGATLGSRQRGSRGALSKPRHPTSEPPFPKRSLSFPGSLFGATPRCLQGLGFE